MSLADHLGYLKARLKEYEARPQYHIASIAAYRNLIQIAETRPQDYEREAGDLFEVARAEQVDRAEAMSSVFAQLFEREAAEAQKLVAAGLSSTKSYADLVSRAGSIKKTAEPVIEIIAQKRNALYEFLGLLLTAHLAPDKDKPGFARATANKWNVLAGLDPQISWQKIRSHPPYRNMIYYSDAQLDMLERWHGEMK
jgi:hypothetical protein